MASSLKFIIYKKSAVFSLMKLIKIRRKMLHQYTKQPVKQTGALLK